MSQESTPIMIETPDGSYTAQKKTIDPTPQEITPVTGANLTRLMSLSAKGPQFVASYAGNVSNPDLADYDRAFYEWQRSSNPKHSTEEVIEILGGYLGGRCLTDFEMEWVLVTDEYGSDYAVRSKSVEVMAFPFSSVAKRIENSQYDFVYGVYHAVKQTLSSGDYESREKD